MNISKGTKAMTTRIIEALAFVASIEVSDLEAVYYNGNGTLSIVLFTNKEKKKSTCQSTLRGHFNGIGNIFDITT